MTEVSFFSGLSIEKLNAHPEKEVDIEYFVPDDRKAGGAYVSVTGMVRLIELGKCNSSQALPDEQLVNHLRKVPDFGKPTIRSGSCIPLDIKVSVMLHRRSMTEDNYVQKSVQK